MRRVVARILYVLSCALVALSVALVVLAAVFLVPQVAVSLRAAPLALAVTQALPGWLAFWGVLSSPFGGVFRTDFVLVALAAFIVSKLVRKIARAL